MSLTAAEIPSADTSPPIPVESEIRPLIVRHVAGRRSVLRGITMTGMVVGLAALDLIPWGHKAHAAPPYSTWTHCRQYGGKTGNPQTDWRWCNPSAADVSSRYCAGNGYHRTDRLRIDNCIHEEYRIAYRCYPGPRNAWEWRKDGEGLEPPNVRCSDGTVYVRDRCGDDYSYKSGCKKSL